MRVVCTIATPVGPFEAHFTQHGLAGLRFPRSSSSSKKRAPERGAGLDASILRRWQQQTRRALLKVLSGLPTTAAPPLDLSSGTSFQQKVWAALRRIPPGKTKSYGEIAAAIGRPKAARAVGAACGANPIPVIIPCHRVLATGGALGGFSGGLEWKRRLLTSEGRLPVGMI